MKPSFALFAGILAAMTTTFAAANLQEIPLQDIDGKATSLKAYNGKVVLLVNVASRCGYTKQYKGLEALYQKYKDRGLVVVGVPSNDFGAQEPGSAEEIKQFCSTTYNVTFPLMSKVHVKGSEQHPLYAALTSKDAPFPGDVAWNFGKFLIGRDGKVVARFDSAVTPESQELTSAVEKALAAQ
jgi:glutathione peroxidase